MPLTKCGFHDVNHEATVYAKNKMHADPILIIQVYWKQQHTKITDSSSKPFQNFLQPTGLQA